MLLESGRDSLDVALRPVWDEAETDGARLRVVIDQVAQLTDAGALAWHARLGRG